MMAKSNAPRSLPAAVSPRRHTGFLRPTYAPEPCGESCAIMSRANFRLAPCDPRPAANPAKSPCLLTFWLSCSSTRKSDLFPNGIDAIRTQRLIPLRRNRYLRLTDVWSRGQAQGAQDVAAADAFSNQRMR